MNFFGGFEAADFRFSLPDLDAALDAALTDELEPAAA